MSGSRWRTAALAGSAILLGVGVGLQIGEVDIGLGVESGLILAIVSAMALTVIIAATSGEPPVAEVTAVESAWMEFRRELRRARRHERPLTLIRIPPPARDDGSEPIDLAPVSRHIDARLRLIDRAWLDDGSIYVMLPESGRPAAATVVDRLAAVAPAGSLAGVRIASFPDDGLTSGAIIAAVHDAAMDQVPILIRPIVEDPIIAAMEDGLPVGETAIHR